MTNDYPNGSDRATARAHEWTAEVMGRHKFNSFLDEVYGCTGNNDVKADKVLARAEKGRSHWLDVELFNSPHGQIIAAYDAERDAYTVVCNPEAFNHSTLRRADVAFIHPTRADEKSMRKGPLDAR